ncbi:hypothetical protein PBY51_004686 [Eleginops maclovinus]|uniref:Uncharacterized protein n=1 Tax=Eleginops maclovinus TaxID=56733 RepID=A0AAN8AGN3_ELEMC|nr:hypothetical protein PBY51_004686 [Eleginops maclovinus]
MFCEWRVNLGEGEEDFLVQIPQPGEDFAPRKPPDLGVQEQLLEVRAHLITEDREKTGPRDFKARDLIKFTIRTASSRTARNSWGIRFVANAWRWMMQCFQTAAGATACTCLTRPL